MPVASNSTGRKKIHPFRLVRYAWAFLRPATRKRKALLIAAGSAKGMEPLVGPQLDVERMRKLLIDQFGYKPSDIVMLTDRPGGTEDIQPTYGNIMNGLERFFDNQRDGSRYFFYYAGHAARLRSKRTDREDRSEECILPSDSKRLEGDGEHPTETYYENGIPDSVLKEYLVNHLSPKSYLVAIVDSCHSGTLLDLPHFRCNRVYAMSSLWRRAVRRVLESYRRRGDRLFTVVTSLAPAISSHRADVSVKPVCGGYCPRSEWSHNIICISSCKHDQKAYEGGDGSSMTNFVINLLEKEPRPTLKRFMRVTTANFQALTKKLKKQWKGPEDFGSIAAPQVSSPEPLNMNRFLII